MYTRFFATLILFLFAIGAAAQNNPSRILILGSDHLQALYKKDLPTTDVLLPNPQQDLERFRQKVLRYQPDLIGVEVLPEMQPLIDSLYQQYVAGNLALESLPDGRSEVYQLAFRMGKVLGLPRIWCVNAPGGTSQGILDNGTGIETYKAEGLALRSLVVSKVTALQKDSLSFYQYLRFLNEPETARKVHHLRYITPARVTNGRFVNPDAAVDTAFVNPRYIGAELTSVFKNRDYKIYSNLVNVQAAVRPKRMLLVIGVAHIHSLKNILRDDEQFVLTEAAKYLN